MFLDVAVIVMIFLAAFSVTVWYRLGCPSWRRMLCNTMDHIDESYQGQGNSIVKICKCCGRTEVQEPKISGRLQYNPMRGISETR